MTRRTQARKTDDPVTRACALHEAAMAAYVEGKSTMAASLWRRALHLLERTAGSEHPDVAAVLHNLAALHEERCEYAQAERLYRRAATIMQGVDRDDDDLQQLRVQSFRHLGHLDQVLGRYDEAEALLCRALAIAERKLGRGHLEVAVVLNDLGMLYKYMGRFTEAKRRYDRALHLLKSVYGPEHTALASLYHNLGGLAHARGRYAQGEPFARRAVELRERELGPEHPEVAADLAALAAVLDGQGKYGEAESLYQRALAIFTRAYGADHHEVAVTLNNLAALQHALGRLTEAIGWLMGFDAARLVNAFGIVYSQLCGTMQAHAEGTVLLGMQIGFNARNAVAACDLAARDVVGPQQVLEGAFGFYRLFEGVYDLSAVWPVLVQVWRITEVAHKPFPAGRATHGIIEACLELQRAHGFAADEIEQVTARIPPLTHRLVSRPLQDDMTPNYARLSAPFVAATALRKGTVGAGDFRPEALTDPATQTLGRRVTVLSDGHPNPNALTPIHVEVRLTGGITYDLALDVVDGHPTKPMTRQAHLTKFRHNWVAGAVPPPPEHGERLIALIDDLERVDDVRGLVELMVA